MMSLKNQLDDANKELFFMSLTDFFARKYYKRLTECKVKLRIYSVEKNLIPCPLIKKLSVYNFIGRFI